MPTPCKADLLALTASVAKTLRMVQGQLREIERAIATLPADTAGEKFSCPECGDVPWIKSQRGLEEHLYDMHGGWEPDDQDGERSALRIGWQPEDVDPPSLTLARLFGDDGPDGERSEPKPAA